MGNVPAESLGTSRKQFMLLEGEPILIHTIRKFVAASTISEIYVAVRPEDMDPLKEQLQRENYSKPVCLVTGGRSRQVSVRNCLAQVPDKTELVCVHDAVRPFVTVSQIDRTCTEASKCKAAILAIPPVDTIKQVDRTVIRSTLVRERVVLAQTPQAFHFSLLKRAFEQADRDGFQATDEASLVEHVGAEVNVVLGSDRNIKITKPGDMALAYLFYREEAGLGTYDSKDH